MVNASRREGVPVIPNDKNGTHRENNKEENERKKQRNR
jgi:hypothetical protein